MKRAHVPYQHGERKHDRGLSSVFEATDQKHLGTHFSCHKQYKQRSSSRTELGVTQRARRRRTDRSVRAMGRCWSGLARTLSNRQTYNSINSILDTGKFKRTVRVRKAAKQTDHAPTQPVNERRNSSNMSMYVFGTRSRVAHFSPPWVYLRVLIVQYYTQSITFDGPPR